MAKKRVAVLHAQVLFGRGGGDRCGGLNGDLAEMIR